MDAFTEFLKTIKFPTLSATGMSLLFGFLLTDGVDAIDSIPEGFGVFFLALGAVFLVVTFNDFRYKDSTDNIISSQDKSIKTLQGVISSMSKTRKMGEQLEQKTMASDSPELGGRGGRRKYDVDDSNSTPTS